MKILKPALILLIGLAFFFFINSLNFATEDKILVYYALMLFLLMFIVWAVYSKKPRENKLDVIFNRY